MAKGVRRVRIFSALEVANICGVVNQTAINWIRSGYLKAFTTPGGQYRVYAKDLSAFLDKRGMGDSGEVLQEMMEKADWNTFLVAAEQSVNDPLKAKLDALFPEYEFIQAYDWFEAGRRFTEARPGFVIVDAELPGADVFRFIHTVKGDPFFGKPCVLLFTDNSSLYQKNQQREIDSLEARRWEADAVLGKPLEIGSLEAIIRSMEKQPDVAVIA